MHTLSADHPLPLYAQLADLLRQRIARGHWQEGDRLPSLEELTREFSVARVTVRQAIGLLQSDGLVASRQGRGTFVTAPAAMQRRIPMQAELQSLAHALEGEHVHLITLEQGSAAPQLTERDGVAAGDYVSMRRVHLHGATPFCVSQSYLDRTVFRRAPERFDREAAVPVLLSLPGLVIAQAWHTLTVGVAGPELAGHLRVPPSAPVAELRLVCRTPDGTAIYLAEVVCRGDLMQWEVDLAP